MYLREEYFGENAGQFQILAREINFKTGNYKNFEKAVNLIKDKYLNINEDIFRIIIILIYEES